MATRSHLFRCVAFGIALSVALVAVGTIYAQVVTPFAVRYANVTTGGDIKMAGNTLMTCNGSSFFYGTPCSDVQTGAAADFNDDFDMIYVDTDSDGTTFNSSSAVLTLPPGATILFAGLYWGASLQDATVTPAQQAASNTMRFKTPASGSYQTVTANTFSSIRVTNIAYTATQYGAFANVTSLVQAGGSGTYVGANVQATTGRTSGAGGIGVDGNYAGWDLIVAYKDPTVSVLRYIGLMDGFARVSAKNPLTLTLTGFTVGGAYRHAGILSWDAASLNNADGDLTGAYTLNGTTMNDAARPAPDGYIRSRISANGAVVTTGNPNYVDTLGLDIGDSDASGAVPVGATNATAGFTRSGHGANSQVFWFVTEVSSPTAVTLSSSSAQVDNSRLWLFGFMLLSGMAVLASFTFARRGKQRR